MTCVWLSADGCKALPKPGSGCGNGGCGCNGAWYTHTNGTITSAMDGGCLQASGAKIGVSPCTGESLDQRPAPAEKRPKLATVGSAKLERGVGTTGAANQHWQLAPSATVEGGFTVSQDGKCVDDNALPVRPQARLTHEHYSRHPGACLAVPDDAAALSRAPRRRSRRRASLPSASPGRRPTSQSRSATSTLLAPSRSVMSGPRKTWGPRR